MRRSTHTPAAVPTFESVVARHRHEVLAYLTRLMSNRADAEDVCQDTFLRAHRAYPRLHDRTQVRAWLFTIATRAALNAQRHRRRTTARHVDLNPDTLPMIPASRDVDPSLYRAVNALPVRQRAALMQRIFHDHSYADIAATLGCSAEAARANVYQALKRLKVALRPNQRIQP